MRLEEKVDTLKTLDAEILDHIDDETALAEETEQSDEFKGAVYATIIRAEKCSSPGAVSMPPVSHTTTDPSSSGKSHCVKLPKLTLHPFSGDLTQWLTLLGFIQTCDS